MQLLELISVYQLRSYMLCDVRFLITLNTYVLNIYNCVQNPSTLSLMTSIYMRLYISLRPRNTNQQFAAGRANYKLLTHLSTNNRRTRNTWSGGRSMER